MFTAYFDASGNEEDQPCLAVAGFLAGADAWSSFEQEWLERLAKDGLRNFHRRELAMWEKSKRDRLLNDLIDIIIGNVGRKFGAVIDHESLSVLSPEERTELHLRSYSLAARTCISKVRLWSKSERLRLVPDIVLEDGDAGKGKSIDMLTEQRVPLPTFKPSRDRIEDGFLIKG
ncbi:MAG TPA: hypothetical protein VFA15_05010, partial [Nitrososphaera sp.]|nr:hypothetical protein [Nitrososphaera sp.]